MVTLSLQPDLQVNLPSSGFVDPVHTSTTHLTQESALIKPVQVGQLIEDHPSMRPYVIDGILRRGETCNVIAAAKTGKSFLVGGLAFCVATGRPWLSHEVAQGRVLIIDNELHESTLASRLHSIAYQMQIDESQRGNLDAINLRGVGIDIDSLGARLDIEPGKYSLIVLDALYRFLPSGTSENDNAQMMRIYNRLDELAKAWDCAVVVVHHASKGAQGDKAVVDVGAGAGAIARAADTHLVIRPHESDGLYVLEVACRSFKSPDPVSIRYEYPLWSAVACEAKVLSSMSVRANKQAETDRATVEAIRPLVTGKSASIAEIRGVTQFGHERVKRGLELLRKECNLQSRFRKSKTTGKGAERFKIVENSGVQDA